MVIERSPAMPVYVKDIFTDERFNVLSLAEQGLYFRLLGHQWLEGSIPVDVVSILRSSRREVGRAWRSVSCFFPPHPTEPGRLQNQRLETIRAEMVEHRRRRSVAGAKGAAMTNSRRGNAEDLPSAKSRPAFASASAVEEERETLRASEPPAAPESKPDWSAVERLLPLVGACQMKPPPDEQILGMLVSQFGERLVEEVFRRRAPDLRGKGWQYARKILETWTANPNERPSQRNPPGTDGRRAPGETHKSADVTATAQRYGNLPGWNA